MTTWYRSGTASVANGSTAVTGNLCAWVNNAYPGDWMSFDAGGTWVEIASVESNTALTLAVAYAGTTISGAAYIIAPRSPFRDLTPELHLRVSRLLDAVQILSSTSTTSLTIGTGSKSFTVADAGLNLPVGSRVQLVNSVGKTMTGVVTAYSGLSMTVDVDGTEGSGTYAEWTVSAAGVRGAQGIQGVQGIQGLPGTNGTNGTNGTDGNDGWTAVSSVVSDGERRVIKIVDWTGGEGTKPAINKYVGASGLVDAIGDGVDIRGPSGSSSGSVSYDTSQSLTDTQKATARTNIGVARESLTANRTYYVRTDGSDSNTGLANTSGGAFLTIQKAVNAAAALDQGIYSVTINVGSGTYAENITLKSYVGAGPIALVGNTTTPSNVVIQPSSGQVITATGVVGRYTIAGFKLAATSASLLAVTGSVVDVVGSMEYGAASGAYQIIVSQGGAVSISGNYTISGGAYAHMSAQFAGRISNSSKTVTISGTPAFNIFCLINKVGIIEAASLTFSGSVTGQRYSVEESGVCKVYGAGASYFPGNTAGSTANGGQYV